jgi:hypothetical protein
MWVPLYAPITRSDRNRGDRGDDRLDDHQRNRGDDVEVLDGETLLQLVGVVPPDQEDGPSDQVKPDTTRRQSGSGGIPLGSVRFACQQGGVGSIPAAEESALGGSQGVGGRGAQVGPTRVLCLEKRPNIRPANPRTLRSENACATIPVAAKEGSPIGLRAGGRRIRRKSRARYLSRSIDEQQPHHRQASRASRAPECIKSQRSHASFRPACAQKTNVADKKRPISRAFYGVREDSSLKTMPEQGIPAARNRPRRHMRDSATLARLQGRPT